ncbi:MAG TPA: hypothetical protein VFL77_07665 [Solirubrobacterales bacterium]|nr:hypothetical protein [Solirubrobacterales bacterium]
MMGHGLGRLFVLGIIAAALVIGGCGDSSSSDNGGKPVSTAVFAKRAEAICRKTGEQQARKVQEIAKEHPPTSSARQRQDAELAAQAAKPIFQGMIEELEEIEPPSGKKGDAYREWVEAVEVAVEKIEAPEPGALNATVSAHHKAKRVGLEICSVL